jgi:hypothetical protein
MDQMDVADCDDVHHDKLAGVLFEEDTMFGEKGPDCFLDRVAFFGGANFKPDNQPLITFLGYNGILDLIGLRLFLGKIFK